MMMPIIMIGAGAHIAVMKFMSTDGANMGQRAGAEPASKPDI